MNILKKLFGANELFVATVLYDMHTVIAQEAEKYQETNQLIQNF